MLLWNAKIRKKIAPWSQNGVFLHNTWRQSDRQQFFGLKGARLSQQLSWCAQLRLFLPSALILSPHFIMVYGNLMSKISDQFYCLICPPPPPLHLRLCACVNKGNIYLPLSLPVSFSQSFYISFHIAPHRISTARREKGKKWLFFPLIEPN